MNIHSRPKINDLTNTGSNNSTTYHDIVDTIEPAILYVTYFLRMLRWKDGYSRRSVIALLVWTFMCFHPAIIAYTLPIFITIFVYYGLMTETPIHEKVSTVCLHDKLTTELKDVQFELSMILPSPDRIDQLKQCSRSLFVLSVYQKVLSFVSAYTVWLLGLKLFGLGKIIWFLGSVALSWNSPLFRVICYSYYRAAFIFRHANRIIVSQNDAPKYFSASDSHAHFDRCYRFKVIEHQRWWLHKGWTALLLPNERPRWSDEYLAQVPSIHTFQLPPPITKMDSKSQKMTTITWQWVSQEWQIDDNHNVDKDGWEYGSWDWKSWGSKSSGLRVLTRRRHWARNARLVVVQETEEQQVYCSAPIDIKRSNSYSAASLSTSYTSEDSSSSYLCTTPTSLPSDLLLHKHQTKTYPTSTVSLNHHNQTVEHMPHYSDTASTVESHFWLRR